MKLFITKKFVALLGLVIVIVIVSVYWPGLVTKQPPSCPNHDYPVVSDSDSFSEVPLAGAITDIPEFHDCQRLLIERGHIYGPLVGIWVAEFLDTRLQELADANPPRPGGSPNPEVNALAFAELYSWDDKYPPLGIRTRWNCLYLYPDPDTLRLGAKMVNVSDPKACLNPQPLSALKGDTVTNLFVTRHVFDRLSSDNIPPVARWDWDSVSAWQYIGLKCGTAWCEVSGSKGLASSNSYADPNETIAGKTKPVYSVKGWYDEQVLAVPKPSVMGGLATVRPASFRGTIIPDPGLDTVKLPQFDDWVRAGQVAVTGSHPKYAGDFNYGLSTATNARSMATVFICHGDGCGNPTVCSWAHENDWWARIEYQGKVKFRCVERVDHSDENRPIPATARWAWDAKDEKGWFGCAAGCCTVR